MSESLIRRRVIAGAAALALAAGGTVAAAASAFGAASTLGMTITAIAPKKVAALSANQVVTITGTGFDESLITKVELGGCDSVYVVASATTIYAKTPNATCGVVTSSATTPETITITDTDTNTLTFLGTATTGLFYVAPPGIASTDPVFTDLSANIPDKYKKVKATGGQTIRVVAASDYQFTAGVTATLGGVALTNVTVGGGTVNGNYITGVAGARAAGSAPLVITANGVSKTFSSALTGVNYWAPPTITTVVPSSGRAVPASGSGGDIVLTGTGFSTTAASNTVTLCGQAATVKTTPTPTATSITVVLPDPSLGSNIYEGVCPVKVSVGGSASPVTATSVFAYLIQ